MSNIQKETLTPIHFPLISEMGFKNFLVKYIFKKYVYMLLEHNKNMPKKLQNVFPFTF